MKWLESVAERRGHNKGIVAFGNKMALIIWALLAPGTEYQENYSQRLSHVTLAAYGKRQCNNAKQGKKRVERFYQVST